MRKIYLLILFAVLSLGLHAEVEKIDLMGVLGTKKLELDGREFSSGKIRFGFEKGNASTVPTYYASEPSFAEIRLYGGASASQTDGNVLTFSVPDGCSIRRIEFEAGEYDKFGVLVADAGTVEETSVNHDAVWSGDAAKVAFTATRADANAYSQNRYTGITVSYYDEAGVWVDEPVFSLEEGGYTEAQTLTISCAADATLAYSVNGEAFETESSTATVVMDESKAYGITAVARKGESKSFEVTKRYTIRLGGTVGDFDEISPDAVQDGKYVVAFGFGEDSYVMQCERYESMWLSSADCTYPLKAVRYDVSSKIIPDNSCVFSVQYVTGRGRTIRNNVDGGYVAIEQDGSLERLVADAENPYYWKFEKDQEGAVYVTSAEESSGRKIIFSYGKTSEHDEPVYRPRFAYGSGSCPTFYRVGGIEQVEVPAFSMEAGNYVGKQELKLTSPTAGAAITYSVTLDGAPVLSGTDEASPVSVLMDQTGEYVVTASAKTADGTSRSESRTYKVQTIPLEALNPDDVKEGVYVIACNVGGTTYLMKNAYVPDFDTGNNRFVVAEPFDLTGGEIPGEDFLFSLSKMEGEGYLLKNAAGGYVGIMKWTGGTYPYLDINKENEEPFYFKKGDGETVIPYGSQPGFSLQMRFYQEYSPEFYAEFIVNAEYNPVFYRISDEALPTMKAPEIYPESGEYVGSKLLFMKGTEKAGRASISIETNLSIEGIPAELEGLSSVVVPMPAYPEAVVFSEVEAKTVSDIYPESETVQRRYMIYEAAFEGVKENAEKGVYVIAANLPGLKSYLLSCGGEGENPLQAVAFDLRNNENPSEDCRFVVDPDADGGWTIRTMDGRYLAIIGEDEDAHLVLSEEPYNWNSQTLPADVVDYFPQRILLGTSVAQSDLQMQFCPSEDGGTFSLKPSPKAEDWGWGSMDPTATYPEFYRVGDLPQIEAPQLSLRQGRYFGRKRLTITKPEGATEMEVQIRKGIEDPETQTVDGESLTVVLEDGATYWIVATARSLWSEQASGGQYVVEDVPYEAADPAKGIRDGLYVIAANGNSPDVDGLYMLDTSTLQGGTRFYSTVFDPASGEPIPDDVLIEVETYGEGYIFRSLSGRKITSRSDYGRYFFSESLIGATMWTVSAGSEDAPDADAVRIGMYEGYEFRCDVLDGRHSNGSFELEETGDSDLQQPVLYRVGDLPEVRTPKVNMEEGEHIGARLVSFSGMDEADELKVEINGTPYEYSAFWLAYGAGTGCYICPFSVTAVRDGKESRPLVGEFDVWAVPFVPFEDVEGKKDGKYMFVGLWGNLSYAMRNSSAEVWNTVGLSADEIELRNGDIPSDDYLFDIATVADGLYTIRDCSGRYLSAKEQDGELELILSDEVCRWSIGEGSVVINGIAQNSDVKPEGSDAVLKWDSTEDGIPTGFGLRTEPETINVRPVVLYQVSAEASGVDGVGNDGTRIYSDGGDIVVETPADCAVEVIDASGLRVAAESVTAGTVRIPVAAGFYVVKAGATVRKVAVE